ncbi:penicillin-binding protein activator LpoB [Serratia microhaemolytica]|uniref:penicillin-binding protein activator LpoB n=1 Tax=Serratia microhaemolytica TaxID=2675110 RepID=UPI000FDDF9B9|nr:penicillin-binding protein activator LpoB [Serratia microhaemolytica]
MKKYLSIVLVALMLTGCLARPPAPVTPPITVEPPPPPPKVIPVEPPAPPEVVPPPPKIQQINWQSTLRPLVAKMLSADEIVPGSVLLVDGVKNSTNGTLQISQATDALYGALASNPHFTLVSQQEWINAQQTLGLSAEDSLASRSKAIGLARVVGAQYVLYSDVSGDVTAPTIDMQLMLVQSGEIVWSGESGVRY